MNVLFDLIVTEVTYDKLLYKWYIYKYITVYYVLPGLYLQNKLTLALSPIWFDENKK